MPKIETVIFDWAGTTVDYGCFAPVNAFMETFRAFGIEPTIQETREPMGMLKIDHIRTMLSMERIGQLWEDTYGKKSTEEDVCALYEMFEKKLLESLRGYVQPKPYVLDTVRALREKEIKIGSTTGYNDKMMAIVTEGAAEMGYQPDCWFSPDAVGGKGRPYPYMIFQNLQMLQVLAVDRAVKVGDTVSDMKEGKNAGCWSVGVLEGSSELALTEEEFLALSHGQQQEEKLRVRQRFLDAGADFVIDHLGQLPDLVASIERI